jgi:uracil-DNA glycosylase family 4
MVNWDKLGELEDWNHGWRTALDTKLSERYVPGEGDNPRVLLVGEAPGAQEDVALRPFVGPAGRVLRDLMASVGLYTGQTPHFGEPNCWLTNLVHFRPPRNRNPLPSEITVARSGLREEWRAVGRPRVIIPVGGIALKAICGKDYSILACAGKPIFYESRRAKLRMTIWPTIHPSYGLRIPDMIPHLENDWAQFEKWWAANGQKESRA